MSRRKTRTGGSPGEGRPAPARVPSGAPDPLDDVRRWALAQGLGAALADPLVSLVVATDVSPSVFGLVRAVCFDRPGASIGDFLGWAAAGAPFIEGRVLNQEESRSMPAAIRGYLDVCREPGHVPPSMVPPPPTELGPLARWAHELGLRGVVDLPVRAALDVGPQQDDVAAVTRGWPGLSVGQLFSSESARWLEKLVRPEVAGRVRLAARAWLFQVAVERCRAVREDGAAAWRRGERPRDEVRAALAAGLENLKASLLRRHLPVRRRALEAISTCFEDEPPRITWEAILAEAGQPRQPLVVRLLLGDFRKKALRATCECVGGRPSACRHVLPALETLLDAVYDAKSGLGGQIVAALGKPEWTKALRAIDEELGGIERAAGGRSEATVSWVISRAANVGVSLSPRIERPRQEESHWWWDARHEMSELLENPDWWPFPHAREVVGLLVGARATRYGGAPERRVARHLVWQALELLIGYPRVWIGHPKGAPATIRRGTLEIVLRRTACGALELIPTVDGDPRTADGLVRQYDGDEHVALIDKARRACVLVRVDPRAGALIAACKVSRSPFPPEAEQELLRRLMPLEPHVLFQFPADLAGALVEPDRRLVLRLEPTPEGGLTVEALVRPIPGGVAFAPGEGPSSVGGLGSAGRVRAERDLAAEAARARSTLATLPMASAAEARPWFFRVPPGDAALDLVAHLRRQPTEDLVVEWPRDGLKVTPAAFPVHLRVQVESRQDWFGVKGGVEIDGEKVELAVLLEAARAERRFVAVGPGRWVEISGELRARLKVASDVLFEGRGGLEASAAAAPVLADLFDAVGEARLSDEWRALVSRLKEARAFEPKLPRSLKAQLRPYQLDGYRWLGRLAAWGVGGCLADDMGLGKTVQALAALLARGSLGPALVVAPTSVCFNWVREARRFAPSLNPILFREGDREATLAALGPKDVLISSWGLVVLHAEQLKARPFATLVLDEAQAVKNPATKRARAVRDLDAAWRVALSGTPVENHLGELWSLFRIVAPGLLGSWEQFKARFALPIERDKDPARREALARVVRPFILRRTKAAVAPELPARTEIRDTVPLSHAERELYESVRLAALARLASPARTGARPEQKRFVILAAITELRQLACHPRLHDPASPLGSSKLGRFLELVDELLDNGHRALVFSQFTSHLALVREALDARKVSYLYLDGQTPEAERVRRVDAFQGGEAELFLISLKAGGTGLNLTAADYVIHLDPWWNPAVEDQATDRAHRIGQTKPVTVYRLVSKGTIEEAILALHEEKRDLVAGVLGGTDAAGALSPEELLELIRTGEADVVAEELQSDADAAGQRAGDELVAAEPGRAAEAPGPGADLRALVEAFCGDLEEQHAPGEALNLGTVRSYSRAARRFADFAAGHRGSPTVGELAVAYREALERGTVDAPVSEPLVARAMLGRLVRFAQGRA